MSLGTHLGKCQFCHRELLLRIDGECSEKETAAFVLMAACDRCSDYRRVIRKLNDSAEKMALDYSRNDSEARRRQMEPGVRLALENLSKRLVQAANRHYNVASEWSSEIVGAIMEQPGKAAMVMGFCEAQIRKVRRQADASHVEDTALI